jgi:hypothetical protein
LTCEDVVSYVLGKILVRFHRFIRYFKEVRENVSIISEQPSYIVGLGLRVRSSHYSSICTLTKYAIVIAELLNVLFGIFTGHLEYIYSMVVPVTKHRGNQVHDLHANLDVQMKEHLLNQVRSEILRMEKLLQTSKRKTRR